MHAIYVTSAKSAKDLPKRQDFPEVGVIGRSNCGKSSLINAILNRTALARKSRTPGRTQMANYFLVDDKLFFVDLPGYGFSAAAKSSHKEWQDLLTGFLKRRSVQNFLFLMDVRRDFDANDRLLIHYLGDKARLNIVLTKIDKLSRPELKKRFDKISEQLADMQANYAEISLVSSLKKTGIEELRASILAD